MDLLQYPSEIVEHIISKCDLFTLLQLRLVSKTLSSMVNTSSRFPEMLESVQINLHIETLGTFVESAPRLPFSSFIFCCLPLFCADKNEDSNLHDKESVDKIFLEQICPHIRKLEVITMFSHRASAISTIFTAMKNLRDLHIFGLVTEMTEDFSLLEDSTEISQLILPFTEPNLKIRRFTVTFELHCGDYLIEWIKLCPLLEYTSITTSHAGRPIGSVYYGQTPLVSSDSECYPYILRLGSEGHLKHLKQLDFDKMTLKLSVCSRNDIQFFQNFVSNTSVSFVNVTPSFFHEVLTCSSLSLKAKEAFKQRIKSFQGMSELLKGDGFANLSALNCNSLFTLPPNRVQNSKTRTLQLPELTKINAILWSERDPFLKNDKKFFESLFHPNKPRSSVTDLSVSFNTDYGPEKIIGFKPSFLDAGFPNLTQLMLRCESKSPSDQTQLCNLIQVITKKCFLQELHLFSYLGIPEGAFFGDKPLEPPIFLRLKNLKKLKLESHKRISSDASDSLKIQRMGNQMITLLSKMCLNYLQISGDGWDDVTSRGIKRLIDGPFGRSILKFRIESLEDIEGSPLRRSECLERLAKVAHSNRVAKGLTSGSFEEFEASKKLLTGHVEHPFRRFID